MAKKPAELIQIKIMGPSGLHRLVKTEARKSGRSISQEYVYRLQKSFEQETTVDMLKVIAMTAAIEAVRIMKGEHNEAT